MNNVCTKCGKLNTLDRKNCHYCGHECCLMANSEVSKFLINLNSKKETTNKEEQDGCNESE